LKKQKIVNLSPNSKQLQRHVILAKGFQISLQEFEAFGREIPSKRRQIDGSLNHEICRSCQHERGETGLTISITLTLFTMLVMKTFNAVPNTSQRIACHSTKGGNP
jgi:hypothetical protein